jgi:hypothetical protein
MRRIGYSGTAAKGKGKRSRPRKDTAPETAGDAVPLEEEAEEAGSSASKNMDSRPSEVEPARPLFPWQAPVAHMY